MINSDKVKIWHPNQLGTKKYSQVDLLHVSLGQMVQAWLSLTLYACINMCCSRLKPCERPGTNPNKFSTPKYPKGRHQKKKLQIWWNFHYLPYPPPPLMKEWKTKEWNIGMFETPPSPQLRVKNLVVFKVYCNTFVVTFQCSEKSLTSSESKQDETKLDKANIQCR